MSWRMKRFFRKWTPIAVIASVLWVGFTHWQRGGRSNLGSLLNSAKVAAMRVPVLGSYFKHSRSDYAPSHSRHRGQKSFAYSKRSKRHGSKARHRRARRS
jgi:hypothetical protein